MELTFTRWHPNGTRYWTVPALWIVTRAASPEVAVIGTAHERWVEQVTAVVVPNKPGVTVERIAAWCAADPDLREMHGPKRIEIVDALPRTGSGKLNRPELRAMFP